MMDNDIMIDFRHSLIYQTGESLAKFVDRFAEKEFVSYRRQFHARISSRFSRFNRNREVTPFIVNYNTFPRCVDTTRSFLIITFQTMWLFANESRYQQIEPRISGLFQSFARRRAEEMDASCARKFATFGGSPRETADGVGGTAERE